MKIKFPLLAALLILTGMSLAFAGAPVKTMVVRQNPVPQAAADPDKNVKDILFKLVRQDEYLDEALERLDSEKPPSAKELSSLSLNLKHVTASLGQASALNKREFSGIQPESRLSRYTNAIFSYSRKLHKKTARIGALVAQLSARNKKASMRDAVGLKKGKKGGKKIAQLLAGQKAARMLAVDARKLRAASRDLNATSKWLYIASR
ncbi:MAG: hypothetical protein COT18_12060 [Elusimicrobia bacterium CG08_land_8_20_14_0_20_59_10]|nr:MAG: hypothetical protein COT18_12060 [Elusimicrobia bacterium CG08_land_8_20_14_0_20_59_10]